jgi:sarcosine oxidase subunit gamma
MTLAERTGLAVVQVSAWRATSGTVIRALTELFSVRPPERPNTMISQDDVRILSIGFDRWLIVESRVRDPHLALELSARLPSEVGAVIDLSAARSVFIISGPWSREVLAKHLSLDLSRSSFATDHFAQSVIAGVPILVHSESDDTFQIFAYRSFALHLREVLADAAREFGVHTTWTTAPNADWRVN